jgi:hypothetical protein
MKSDSETLKASLRTYQEPKMSVNSPRTKDVPELTKNQRCPPTHFYFLNLREKNSLLPKKYMLFLSGTYSSRPNFVESTFSGVIPLPFESIHKEKFYFCGCTSIFQTENLKKLKILQVGDIANKYGNPGRSHPKKQGFLCGPPHFPSFPFGFNGNLVFLDEDGY